jgi:hypothetical protein
MKLTDKTLTAFEKWYNLEFEKRNLPYSSGFNISDDSIKFGVYQEFFDSKDIIIQISLYNIDSNNWEILIDYGSFIDGDEYRETHLVSRQEARTEAIKKANKIFNNEV